MRQCLVRNRCQSKSRQDRQDRLRQLQKELQLLEWPVLEKAGLSELLLLETLESFRLL